ncbi:hypothetical protein CYMTET_6527 [Cymbomonas tetramitiformis]|uniref:Thioredoxin domain-containing protein n=1 Tax=Cymbomonas tetramitiformis TaxID=36881 RepID=A0AAE0GX88_9CHLO|nr:hypothetical protein CYMTET_6527 [Cymbomonas tetramitiformis]
MAFRSILLFLLVVTCCNSATAFYNEDGPVTVFSSKDQFNEEVLKATDSIWMITFFTPDCAPCQALEPEFNKLATKLAGIAKVGAVDLQAAQEVAKQLGIQQLPTIKFFAHEPELNPYTKVFDKTAVDYKGPRTAKKMADFLTAQLPTFITVLEDAAGYSHFKSDNSEGLASAILFSSKEESSPLYKALSLQFKDRLRLAEVRTAEGTELAGEFGVDTLPTVILEKSDGTRVQYDGTIGAEPLADFFTEYAAAAPEPKETNAQQKAPQVAPLAEIPDFEATVLESEDIWLVAFTKPEEEKCKEENDKLVKTVNDLHGLVKAGQVVLNDEASVKLATDWTATEAASGEACYQIALFPFGPDKADADAEIFSGELDVKKLQEFVFESVPSLVTPVTSQNSDQFLQMGDFSMPKLILFSKKTEISGTYKSLAMNFRSDFAFGFASSTDTALATRFQITTFPKLLLLIAQPTEDGQVNFGLQPYNGALNYQQMSLFCKSIAMQLEMMKNQGQEQEVKKEAPAEVVEVSTNDEMYEACAAKGGLCVIALLDATSETHGANLEVLTKVATMNAGKPFSFSWVNAPRQFDFSMAFEKSPEDVPTVVILSYRKLRFAPLRGSFGVDEIDALMTSVATGRTGTQMIQEMPKLVDGGIDPPAQEEMIEEEEFDLSDLMGEEIDSGIPSKEDLIKQAEKEIEEEKARKKREAEEAAEKEKAEKSKKDKKKKKKNKKKKELHSDL